MASIGKVDWHTRKTPDFDSIIGKGLGPRYFEYTWRDVILYALGVGCTKDDLPCMGRLPGWFQSVAVLCPDGISECNHHAAAEKSALRAERDSRRPDYRGTGWIYTEQASYGCGFYHA